MKYDCIVKWAYLPGRGRPWVLVSHYDPSVDGNAATAVSQPEVRRLRRRLMWLALGGFAATSMAVIGGAAAGAATPGADGQLWSLPTVPVSPSVDLVVALGLFYAGMILLVRAWLSLRKTVLSHPVSMLGLALVIIAWAAPFALGPPLASRDVYAYAAQGELADEGFDVYREGPVALGDSPVLDTVDPLYLDAPVVYGPVFVHVSALVSSRSDDVIGSVLMFRWLAIVGLVVSAVAVHDLAKRFGRNSRDAIVLAIANPLTLLHLVSGAHNEAMMLAVLLAGVAIGLRPRLRFAGIALCAIAASIKIPAVLGVAFLAWPWITAASSRLIAVARAGWVGGLALSVIGVAGRLTGWGWDWVEAMLGADPVEAYLSVTSIAGVAIHTVTGANLATILAVARTSGLVIAGTITLWLLIAGKQSAPVALGWSLTLFALLHPTTQPWYLLWGLMLIASTSAGGRNRSFVALSAMASLVVLPTGPQLALGLVEDQRVLAVGAAMALLIFLTFNPMAAARPGFSERRTGDLVSVIVPTRHEASNVEELSRRVASAADWPYELIFVDDSDDDTPAVLEELAHRDSAVSYVHRQGAERWGGLGGAVVDGFHHARGAIAVVLDGDLQHPPEALPELIAELRTGHDLVVASRRLPDGSDAGLTRFRSALSRGAAFGCQGLFPARLGRTGDPLSGFFAVRIDQLDVGQLEPDGFKILVEILGTHPDLDVGETPFRFEARAEGVSKADVSQGFRFVGHLVDLRLRTSRPWAGVPNPQRLFRQV